MSALFLEKISEGKIGTANPQFFNRFRSVNFTDSHNSAKVLVTHSEYTIYHEHLPGKLTQDGIADTIAVSKQNRVVFNLSLVGGIGYFEFCKYGRLPEDIRLVILSVRPMNPLHVFAMAVWDRSHLRRPVRRRALRTSPTPATQWSSPRPSPAAGSREYL